MEAKIQQRFWHDLTDPDRIRQTAWKVTGTSRVRGRDGMLPSSWWLNRQSEADEISARMRDGSYRPITYRQTLKSRGAARTPREISIPSVRDRAPLRLMCEFLQRFASAAVPQVPQAKINDVIGALSSRGYKYFVRIDVKDFFPSLDHTAVKLAVEQHVVVSEIVAVIMGAISTSTAVDQAPRRGPNSRGVPQGLAISNVLAEISLEALDAAMTADPSGAYFRYVDDILVLTRRVCHRKVFGSIVGHLETLGLTAHELDAPGSKSCSGRIDEGVEYLGYYIKGSLVTVRESSVRNLERAIAKVFSRYRYELARPQDLRRVRLRLEWYLNLLITGCVWEQRKHGWLHFFSHMRDFSLLRKLDSYVSKKMRDYKLVGKLTPKTFRATFRFAAKRGHDRTGLVPNFDLYTTNDKRRTLAILDNESWKGLEHKTDLEINILFKQRLDKKLAQFERDLSIIY